MKHFSRISKVLFLQLFLSQFINAQTSNQSIIPPSPTAMAFQKFIDYPVDISTGVPQISVPLYTIHLKDYSFPITASFHASGRKPDFNFSPLGLNWALATGVINREIRGRPDESISYHVEQPASYYYPQSQHFYDLVVLDPTVTSNSGAPYGSPKDNEYDIYSLSVNGISTKFIIKDNGAIVFLTYSPYTLTGSLSSNFVLTDDKGIVYTFGFTETASSNPLITKPTSWYLTSITTPSGSSITFSYVHPMVIPATWLGNRTYTDLGELKDADVYNPNSCNYPYCDTWPLFQQYYTTQDGFYKTTSPVETDDYNMCYLQEIDFDNGKINFSYPSTTGGGDFLLNSCTVNTSQNKIIKTIDFSYYPYLPGTDLALFNNNSRTIQDIIFKDRSNTEIQKYSFDYYPGTPGGDVASFAKAKDLWGYCNTSTSGNQIPVQTIHIDHGANANQSAQSYDYNTGGNIYCRTPSLSAKLVGMVKTIHYPTGGSTTFTYEANRVLDHTMTEIDGPGIRLQKVVSDDGKGNVSGKTYTYSGGITAAIPSVANDYFTEKRVMIFSNIDFSYNTSQTFDQAYVGSYKYRQYSSNTVPEVAAASGYPVYYQSVTESDFSSSNKNNGQTIYQYSYPEYDRTSSYFSYPTQYGPTFISSGTADNFTPQVISFREWTTPQLTGKIVQKYDAVTSSYKIVSNTSINYTNLNVVNIPQVSLYKYLEFPTDNDNGTYRGTQKTAMTNPNLNWQVYTVLDRTISCAIMKPSSETTTTYSENGTPLTKTTSYYYDNLVHVNPTRVVTSSSDAKTITQYFTYSGDYSGNTSSISSLPIEKVTAQTKNGVSSVISGQITTYTNNVIDHLYKLETSSPISIGSFKFSNRALGTVLPAGSATSFAADSRYSLKTTYTYDPNNNPITIVPTNNNTISYIWDYNNSYPIAEATNATESDIAYTSFEAEGKGNWNNYTGTITTVGASPFPPTGNKYYNLTPSATLSKAVISGNTYIISYWSKNGLYSIIGGSGTSVTGRTFNGWTYYEHKITASSSTLTISDTGAIDEVRLYPYGSQMTTYTYEPLVGMTSQCDANNRITYYEYDNFGRLMLMKDQNGNILKKYCYNYAGEQGQCNLYQSDAIDADYYSQNCGSESAIAYHVSVPQGMFTSYVDQATANQLAQQYAQNQANQYGSCQATVSLYGDDEVGTNFSVTLHNISTGQDYPFNLYAHNADTMGDVPPGEYDISLTPNSSTGWFNYSVGCGYYDEGPGGSTVTFYAVEISSSCNVIAIN